MIPSYRDRLPPLVGFIVHFDHPVGDILWICIAGKRNDISLRISGKQPQFAFALLRAGRCITTGTVSPAHKSRGSALRKEFSQSLVLDAATLANSMATRRTAPKSTHITRQVLFGLNFGACASRFSYPVCAVEASPRYLLACRLCSWGSDPKCAVAGRDQATSLLHFLLHLRHGLLHHPPGPAQHNRALRSPSPILTNSRTGRAQRTPRGRGVAPDLAALHVHRPPHHVPPQVRPPPPLRAPQPTPSRRPSPRRGLSSALLRSSPRFSSLTSSSLLLSPPCSPSSLPPLPPSSLLPP
eukprot:2145399-Rhodomonas_salina.1